MKNISLVDEDLVPKARELASVLADGSRARQFIEALCDRVEALESDIVVMNSVTSRMSTTPVGVSDLEARFNAFEQKVNPILMDLPMQIREIVKSVMGK